MQQFERASCWFEAYNSNSNGNSEKANCFFCSFGERGFAPAHPTEQRSNGPNSAESKQQRQRQQHEQRSEQNRRKGGCRCEERKSRQSTNGNGVDWHDFRKPSQRRTDLWINRVLIFLSGRPAKKRPAFQPKKSPKGKTAKRRPEKQKTMLSEAMQADLDRWAWIQEIEADKIYQDEDGDSSDWRAEDLEEINFRSDGRDLFTGRHYLTPSELEDRKPPAPAARKKTRDEKFREWRKRNGS